MNSDQREFHKHTVRRLKAELYEYESELKVCKDGERVVIINRLVNNIRKKLDAYTATTND